MFRKQRATSNINEDELAIRLMQERLAEEEAENEANPASINTSPASAGISAEDALAIRLMQERLAEEEAEAAAAKSKPVKAEPLPAVNSAEDELAIKLMQERLAKEAEEDNSPAPVPVAVTAPSNEPNADELAVQLMQERLIEAGSEEDDTDRYSEEYLQKYYESILRLDDGPKKFEFLGVLGLALGALGLFGCFVLLGTHIIYAIVFTAIVFCINIFCLLTNRMRIFAVFGTIFSAAGLGLVGVAFIRLLLSHSF